MLDCPEIQIDLTATLIEYQEVALGFIFKKRIYFRQIPGSDSSVSLKSNVAHGINIPGYKRFVNIDRVKYLNRRSTVDSLPRNVPPKSVSNERQVYQTKGRFSL